MALFRCPLPNLSDAEKFNHGHLNYMAGRTSPPRIIDGEADLMGVD